MYTVAVPGLKWKSWVRITPLVLGLYHDGNGHVHLLDVLSHLLGVHYLPVSG